MVDAEELKRFLLHEDQWVREFVAEYFSDAWSQDEELTPLILRACEEYGDEKNSFVLAKASRFPLTDDAFLGVLERLRKATAFDIAFHLNQIVAAAPVELLLAHETDIVDAGNVFEDVTVRIERRRHLAGESGECLWQELQDFSDNSRDKRYVGDIDHAYADDIVEALAAHEAPDVKTICEMLRSPEVEEEWLENSLVDLAGSRRSAEAVPALVDKLRIDADYLLDRAVRALSRIGDPEAVRLIREMFPGENWTFKLYATGLLGRLKVRESEEAILALLESETEMDIRAGLCFALCKQFSRRGVEAVRQEIESGYDRGYVCLEDYLLVVADVLGLSLPDERRWRAKRDKKKKSQEEAREALAEMEESYYALEQTDMDPFVGIDDDSAWAPPEDLQPFRRANEKVGRNDPCPCGSGRKYKKCCGKASRVTANGRTDKTGEQAQAAGRVYQVKVTLIGVEPSVWRRILLPGNITLRDLHYAIQDAMGWTDSHMHEFLVAGQRYSGPEFALEDVRDESEARLGTIGLAEGETFLYVYDFGDNWEHEILVESIISRDEPLAHPTCESGARACPPDNCGGAWGYEELLQTLQDPDHPEHEEMLEWVGGNFDPEAVDLAAINRRLQGFEQVDL